MPKLKSDNMWKNSYSCIGAGLFVPFVFYILSNKCKTDLWFGHGGGCDAEMLRIGFSNCTCLSSTRHRPYTGINDYTLLLLLLLLLS